jgi:hypothetical protein
MVKVMLGIWSLTVAEEVELVELVVRETELIKATTSSTRANMMAAVGGIEETGLQRDEEIADVQGISVREVASRNVFG